MNYSGVLWHFLTHASHAYNDWYSRYKVQIDQADIVIEKDKKLLKLARELKCESDKWKQLKHQELGLKLKGLGSAVKNKINEA